MNELSVMGEDEREEWRQLRQVVGDSLRDWCDALRTIRDKRLYREDYPTFEAYCQMELGKTRQRIHQVLSADLVRVEIASDASLSKIFDKAPESAVREIAKAPECARKKVAVKVAKEAEETGKPPTAKQVKRVVAEVIAEPKPEPEPVKQVDLHFPAADIAAQVLEIAGQFVQIKRRLTALGKQPGGELCRDIAGDSNWLSVDALRNRILNSAFARVCPHCGGKGCKRCLDRGWQSRADVTLDERAGK